MMKIIAFCFCWFIFLLASFSYGASINGELETIIEGIKYNDSLIQSGKGKLIIERSYTPFGKQKINTQTNHIPQDEKNCVFYTFKNSKNRCDQPNLIEIFDGEKYIVCRNKNSDNPIGEIHATDQTHILFDPRYWGMRYNEKPMGDYLQMYAEKIVGKEKLDEDICTVIEAKSPASSKIKTRLWVNTNKGYRVSKVEWQNPPDKSVIIHRFFYKEYQKEVWFPHSGSYTISYIDKTTGKLNLVVKFSMTTESFIINTDIPDNIFHIDFPKETRIVDYRTGTLRPSEELWKP